MFEFLALEVSTVAGGVIVIFVFAFIRFGNQLVNLLLSYQSSPVETIEETLPDQE